MRTNWETALVSACMPFLARPPTHATLTRPLAPTQVGERAVLVPYRRKMVRRYHEWMKDPFLQGEGGRELASTQWRAQTLPTLMRTLTAPHHTARAHGLGRQR